MRVTHAALVATMTGALALTCLTGCSAGASSNGSSGSSTSSNTDPRVGEVVLPNQNGSTITKRCDGTSLLYMTDGSYSGTLIVITDSPECAK